MWFSFFIRNPPLSILRLKCLLISSQNTFLKTSQPPHDTVRIPPSRVSQKRAAPRVPCVRLCECGVAWRVTVVHESRVTHVWKSFLYWRFQQNYKYQKATFPQPIQLCHLMTHNHAQPSMNWLVKEMNVQIFFSSFYLFLSYFWCD